MAGRGKSAQRNQVGRLQRYYDYEAANANAAPLVSGFAAQHGDYDQAAQTGEMRRAMVNRGGTAVQRWTRDKLLSETQQAAIAHMQRLWLLIGREPRLVANLDRTVFGCPGDGNLAEIDARNDVHRIQHSFPFQFWDVFERVCRWDEPAGTAGSRMANSSRAATTAALVIVGLIADTIYMRERLSY